MNGADRLCDVLLAHGVDVCFANPGTSEMHFVAALDRKPAMRCVLGLFEGVVTAAADGYARMADRPAATLLHLGPGLANGLANLHNARRARTPMVNIVGDHATQHLALDAPLTSDIDSLARPMSHYVRRISGPDDVGPATAEACHAALALPGIATLILPADAAWGEVTPASVDPASAVQAPPRRPAPRPVAAETIRTVAAHMRRAGPRAMLLIGGRALRADTLAVAGRLAAATGIGLMAPMVNARIERGRGRVAIGLVPYPVDMALAALAHVDVLVLVDAQEPVAFFAYPGKPGRLRRPDCAVLTLAEPGDDIAAALAGLADELGVKASAPLPLPPAADEETLPRGPLTDDAIARIVARLMPENAIVCNEAVTSGRRFIGLTQQAPPHDYLQLTGGAIGIGIPLAAGAAIACPGRKVIGLQADGSGMYTLQGLWTQAREGLDVVTILFANRAYAILQGEMLAVGAGSVGRNARRMLSLDEPALDWVAMAKGMGVEAARADDAEQFARLFAAAMARRGPFLIEAVMAPPAQPF